MFSAKSLVKISSLITTTIAVQTSIRKSERVSSDSNESHILKTSGNGNSCDSIRVSHLNEKYCGLISCSTIRRSWTLGSTVFIFETNFVIIALMPFSDSSSVLMKKSRISDIKLVKQKKQSASACSKTPTKRYFLRHK